MGPAVRLQFHLDMLSHRSHPNATDEGRSPGLFIVAHSHPTSWYATTATPPLACRFMGPNFVESSFKKPPNFLAGNARDCTHALPPSSDPCTHMTPIVIQVTARPLTKRSWAISEQDIFPSTLHLRICSWSYQELMWPFLSYGPFPAAPQTYVPTPKG